MKLIRVGVAVALLVLGSCRASDPPPNAPTPWVIGHANAVAEATRFLRAEGIDPQRDGVPDPASFVIFAVSGADGPMLPPNIAFEDVTSRPPERAAILLVYSALVPHPDPELRQLVHKETVELLVARGQVEAAKFERFIDDDVDAKRLVARLGDGSD